MKEEYSFIQMIGMSGLMSVQLRRSFVGALVLALFLGRANSTSTETEGSMSISREGSNVKMRSPFSPEQDLVISIDCGANGQVDFLSTRLFPKDESEGEGKIIHWTQDDCTPWFLNDTYIGGNHGAASVIELTVPSHGKSLSDLGSQWRDAEGKVFNLIKVESSDKLWFLAENAAALPEWRFSVKLPAGPLRRGEEELSFQSACVTQLRPALRITRQNYLVDGKRPLKDGESAKGHFFEVREESEILNPGSVADKILRHPGVECDWTAKDVPALLKQTVVYRFYSNGATVVEHSAEALQPLPLSHAGFVQSQPLVRGNFQTHELYIPKTLPVTLNGKSYDFSGIADFDYRLKEPLIFGIKEQNIQNPDNPPDRFIQILGKRKGNPASREVGFALGYSPLWKMSQTDFRSSVAGFIYMSKKTYPRAMAGKPGVLVPPGTKFHCVAYRAYFDAQRSQPASCVYWFPEKDGTVLYADYVDAVPAHVIDLPAELKSRKFRVLEKSESVHLQQADSFPSSAPTVSTSGRGFLVLLFDNGAEGEEPQVSQPQP